MRRGDLAVSSASNSQERDPFIGDYGGDCGPDVQCWVEVEKAGKDYKASFIAADRMDASKVLCRLDSHMDRGQVLYSPEETFEDALGARSRARELMRPCGPTAGP